MMRVTAPFDHGRQETRSRPQPVPSEPKGLLEEIP